MTMKTPRISFLAVSLFISIAIVMLIDQLTIRDDLRRKRKFDIVEVASKMQQYNIKGYSHNVSFVKVISKDKRLGYLSFSEVEAYIQHNQRKMELARMHYRKVGAAVE
jgi:hypothetical protein